MKAVWLIAAILIVALFSGGQSEVPRLINYQGVLQSGDGTLVEGAYDLTFTAYADSAQAAQVLWSEQHLGVLVTGGIFNVILGSQTVIPDSVFENRDCWLGIQVDSDPELSPRRQLVSVPWAFRAAIADSIANLSTESGWAVSGDDMYATVSGNIGIGTVTPARKLEIRSTLAIARLTSSSINGSYIELKGMGSDPNGVDRGKIRFLNAGDEIKAQFKYSDYHFTPSAFVFYLGGANRMWLTDEGKIGLGTNIPQANLEIVDDAPTLRLSSSDPELAPFIELKGASSGIAQWTYGGIKFLNAAGTEKGRIMSYGSVVYPDGMTFSSGGNLGIKITESGMVGIGTQSPTRPLTVRGNILIQNETTGDPVVEIGEGLDYAEGFDVSDEESIEPGSVLVIDSDNPGQLTMTRVPYDTRVAGIAAGANGLGSGVRLGVGSYDCDVALAGRVYCKVMATDTAIEPGDLLTTSSVPGFAMKATDQAICQGAILGKAMERLERGSKGRILVLVTLQ